MKKTFEQWWDELTDGERKILKRVNSRFIWNEAVKHAEYRAQHVSVFDEQAKFMQACDQTVMTENHNQYILYRELMREEVTELDEAEDIVEMADALIDILVVTIGAGLSLGLPMDRLWNEVMRSNLAKVDSSTGRVRKREDGKVLKPDGWKPPEIAAILNGEK